MDRWMLPDSIVWIMDSFEVASKLIGPVVLAGGAPRDLLLGGEISDYDFFTPMRYRSAAALATVTATVQRKGYKPVNDHANIVMEYDALLFATYTFEHPTEKPIQFMFYKAEGLDFLDSFDMSTSQIMVDMHGTVTSTDAFDTSVIDNVHRVYMKNLKTRYQFEKAFLNHVPRVLTKYPWPVRIDYSGCDLPAMIARTKHFDTLSAVEF